MIDKDSKLIWEAYEDGSVITFDDAKKSINGLLNSKLGTAEAPKDDKYAGSYDDTFDDALAALVDVIKTNETYLADEPPEVYHQVRDWLNTDETREEMKKRAKATGIKGAMFFPQQLYKAFDLNFHVKMFKRLR